MSALATSAKQSAHLAVAPSSGRMAPMGYIKTGRRVPNQTTPQALDHFLIVEPNRGSDGNYLIDTVLMDSLLKAGHGEHDGKIRRLPILFPTDDLEAIYQQEYVWYLGQKKAGWSDGKNFILWFHPRTKVLLDKPWEGLVRPEAGDQHEDVANLFNVEQVFKLHTRLNCLIGSTDAKVGGVYRLSTLSKTTADQIPNTLKTIWDMTGGHIRYLPLDLVIREQPGCPVVNGKPVPTKNYVCHVEMSLKKVREAGGAVKLLMAELNRQLAEKEELKELETKFRTLIVTPNVLDNDVPEGLPFPKQLPAASTPTGPPTSASRPTVTAEMYANSLAAKDTEDAARELWLTVTSPAVWKGFSPVETKLLNDTMRSCIVKFKGAKEQPGTAETQ